MSKTICLACGATLTDKELEILEEEMGYIAEEMVCLQCSPIEGPEPVEIFKEDEVCSAEKLREEQPRQ